MLKTELIGYEGDAETQEKSRVPPHIGSREFPRENDPCRNFLHSRSFQGAKYFHESIEPLAIQLSEEPALLTKCRPDDEAVRQLKIRPDVLWSHSGTNQYWHMCMFFYSAQFGQARR